MFSLGCTFAYLSIILWALPKSWLAFTQVIPYTVDATSIGFTDGIILLALINVCNKKVVSSLQVTQGNLFQPGASLTSKEEDSRGCKKTSHSSPRTGKLNHVWAMQRGMLWSRQRSDSQMGCNSLVASSLLWNVRWGKHTPKLILLTKEKKQSRTDIVRLIPKKAVRVFWFQCIKQFWLH